MCHFYIRTLASWKPCSRRYEVPTVTHPKSTSRALGPSTLDRNKMHSADTAGSVKAVDPTEALIRRKTKQRTATIAQWKLSSALIAQQEGEISRFEGTHEVKNQVLVDFISILKEDTIPIEFASLLTTSDNLFQELAFANILAPHEQWHERVFALGAEHQQVFNKVCQRILGDLFGMFEAALLAPKTTTKAKFYLHVLHCLQGGDGSKLTARIQEMPFDALQRRGGVIDLVQVLSQMLMRWVTASMTTLLLRLNGIACVTLAESHEEELDTENEKREVNRPVPWLGNMALISQALNTTVKSKSQGLGS
jgi:hypothetical protein